MRKNLGPNRFSFLSGRPHEDSGIGMEFENSQETLRNPPVLHSIDHGSKNIIEDIGLSETAEFSRNSDFVPQVKSGSKDIPKILSDKVSRLGDPKGETFELITIEEVFKGLKFLALGLPTDLDSENVVLQGYPYESFQSIFRFIRGNGSGLGFFALQYRTKDFFIVSNLVDDQNNKVILRNETLI